MGAEPSGEAEASEEIKRTEEIPQMQTKTITYVNPIYEDVISEETWSRFRKIQTQKLQHTAMNTGI